MSDSFLAATVPAEKMIKTLSAALHHAGTTADPTHVQSMRIEVRGTHVVVWATDRFTAVALTLRSEMQLDQGWHINVHRDDVESMIGSYKKLSRNAKMNILGARDGGAEIEVGGSPVRFDLTGSRTPMPGIEREFRNLESTSWLPEGPLNLDDKHLEKFRKSRLSSSDRLLVRFQPSVVSGLAAPLILIGDYGVGTVMPARSDGQNTATHILGM